MIDIGEAEDVLTGLTKKFFKKLNHWMMNSNWLRTSHSVNMVTERFCTKLKNKLKIGCFHDK